MTGPLGNSEFCFPRISMFPSTSSRETLRFSGNKIHCSPRDQSLSVKYTYFVYPRSTKEFTRTRSEMSVRSRIELEFGNVSVRLFSNRSLMTSKCGKNKKRGTRPLDECVTDVLTTIGRLL